MHNHVGSINKASIAKDFTICPIDFPTSGPSRPPYTVSDHNFSFIALRKPNCCLSTLPLLKITVLYVFPLHSCLCSLF